MFIFAASLFISSLLLFQIQPLIGKYILPWFGSSPAVWSASLLFFQLLLTAGYAYAYGLVNSISTRKSYKIQLFLLGISFLVLLVSGLFWGAPLLPNLGWFSASLDMTGFWNNPFWYVIAILFLAVGVPYFMLATNSVLIQTWFSRRFPGESPYRLYALSNAASLLGLLSYPFLVEPYLALKSQAIVWSIGFVLFIALTAKLVLSMQNLKTIGTANSGQAGMSIAQPMNPGWMAKLLWMVLPAIASTLLLATTNQITQEVAVIPFLWVIPLSLYLLSFIFCFESDRWYGRIRFFIMIVLAFGVYGLTMSQGPLVEFWVQIAAYCLLLFVVCMVCHGELARLRPEAARLSQFYLLLSFGGALGSMFVNLVAPVIFVYYWELPAALISCLLVCLVIFWLGKQKPVWFLRLIFSLVYIGIGAWIVRLEIKYGQDILYGSEWISRNFFGVMRVKEISVQPEGEPAYQFVHGITIHGLQFKDPQKRGEKTTYYTEGSGAGLAFRFYPGRLEPMTVGILGLGIGTQAAYGREGDEFRLYEINPDVVEIANGYGGFYTYLKDSDADIKIVLGDARISLEQEFRVTGSNLFDLLILDTFSSDAIPVHLITQEAFDIYLKHLKTEGILAIHISNNHLDLKPVVWGLAQYYQLGTAHVVAAKSAPGSSTSVWMLLTRNQSFLNLPAIRPFQISGEDKIREIPMWTDDFSNLFSILK